MIATLQLNLSDALSSAELTALLELATETNKPLERLLFEAACQLVERQRASGEQLRLPIGVPLGKGGML